MVPGAETLLPPFGNREETRSGDGNGDETIEELLASFKLRARFLIPLPLPHLSDCLAGISICKNGRGDGGGVSFVSGASTSSSPWK